MKKLMINLTAICAAACTPSLPHRPKLLATNPPSDRLLQSCDKNESGQVVCPLPEFVAACDETITLWESAGQCEIDKKTCEEKCKIDASASAGEMQQCQNERSNYQWQRWMWGAVGIGVGAAIMAVAK